MEKLFKSNDGKIYATEKECKEADEAYEKAHAEEIRRKEERATRAKEVEDAYKNVLEARKQAAEIIRNAEGKYYKLRDQFIEDYGSYHMTYTNNNGVEQITFGDLMDAVFNGSIINLLK